jgi:hypothetical protein
MKSNAISLILGLLGCVSALAVELSPDEVESKVEKAFEALLTARHHPQGGLQCWAGGGKKKLNVSDEVLLGVMIATIRQDKTTAKFASDPNPAAELFPAARAAGYAMELYPANPHLEAAILDSIREADQSK